jgi:hypothetical protein
MKFIFTGVVAALALTAIALTIASPSKTPAPGPYETRLNAALAECEKAVPEDRVQACVDSAMGMAPEPGFVPCKPGPTLQACTRRKLKEAK